MKEIEILSSLGKWRSMTAEAILSEPAWAVPCRLGDEQATMRRADVVATDTLNLTVRFDEKPHTLAIGRSERFPELSRLWSARTELPEPVLLALVEKECAPLLQLIENTVRRQLSIVGLGGETGENDLAVEVEDVFFSLTRSNEIATALGQLRYIDTSHPSVCDDFVTAECEYAAFAIDANELATLTTGDAVVLPELESISPRMIVERVVELEGGETFPVRDDNLCHVRSASPVSVRLGDVFNGSASIPPVASPLKLVVSGKTVASVRLDRFQSAPVVIVE